jgi:hypothetical protein
MSEARAIRIVAVFLMPLALLCVVLFLPLDDASKATVFIALPSFFLIERKGYPLVANLGIMIAAAIWLAVPDTTNAFFLAVIPLALSGLLLPGRNKRSERWVLSSGGPGVFEFRFRRNS